jgi:hypothetical protein
MTRSRLRCGFWPSSIKEFSSKFQLVKIVMYIFPTQVHRPLELDLLALWEPLKPKFKPLVGRREPELPVLYITCFSFLGVGFYPRPVV